MTIFAGARRALLAAVATLVSIAPLSAQEEISASHLEAGRAALAAVRTTDQFDAILPAAAQALKEQMIQKDPNLESSIVSIVDEKALEIASRRADLENEAARAYARKFNEDELREIAAFYSSPTGVKLIEQGGQITREVVQAAEIWQRGIARDLAQSVATDFEAQNPASPATPVTGEAATPPAQ